MPVESLLSTAYQFILKGELQTAERLLTGLIRKEPQSEPAWLLLAACKRQPEEKEKCLEFVVEINPNNGAALQALGDVLSGRNADAVILDAFLDWQEQEAQREDLMAPVEAEVTQPVEQVESPEAVEVPPAAAPRRVRTIWLWVAVVVLGAGQVLAWLRIWQLEQALAAALVRVQSLQSILTEYIVQIELLQEMLR